MYRIGRLLRSADPTKGIAYLEEAERLGQSLGDPVLVAYALFDRGTIQCIGGDVARGLDAMALGDAALDALTDRERSSEEITDWIADSLPAHRRSSDHAPDERASLARVHPRRGAFVFWLSLAGRYDEARTIGEPYLVHVDTLADPGAIVRSSAGDAHFGLALAKTSLGLIDAAESHFQNALQCYRTIDHHMLEAVAYDAWLANVVLSFQSTRLEKRKQLLSEVQSDYERAKGALVAGLATRVLWSYDVLLANGFWASAREDALQARAHGDVTHRFYASAALAQLACRQGDRDVAWALIGETLPDGAETKPGNVRFCVALALVRCAAELALDSDDLAGARDWIAAHDRWLTWSNSRRWQPDGLLLWTRWLRAGGQYDAAVQAATNALELATELGQPIAQLAAHRALGELASDRRAWIDAERSLIAALALADDCGAPYERCLSALSLAEMWSARGDRDQARGHIADVVAFCEQSHAVPIRRRAEQIEANLSPAASTRYPAGLSDREVEVLRLVARGMTNAMVGAELSISPRTVQQHLTNLYSKLNVTSRAAATRYVMEQGLD